MSKLSEYIGNDPIALESLRIMSYNLRLKDPTSNFIAGLLDAVAEDIDGKKPHTISQETLAVSAKVIEYGMKIANELSMEKTK